VGSSSAEDPIVYEEKDEVGGIASGLNFAEGVAFGSDGCSAYIADSGNHRVLKVVFVCADAYANCTSAATACKQSQPRQDQATQT
jgi:hypothetical protein